MSHKIVHVFFLSKHTGEVQTLKGGVDAEGRCECLRSLIADPIDCSEVDVSHRFSWTRMFCSQMPNNFTDAQFQGKQYGISNQFRNTTPAVARL